MKVGILTHPQGANYGGILQCYALCFYLRKLGFEPIVLRREMDRSFFLWELVRSILRFFHFPRYYNPKEVDKTVKIRPFVESYLVRTLPIRSQTQMRGVCRKYQFGAVIVGSDQVWRKNFALNFGYNYFLDFVPQNVKKFSYAASLGLSEWQYDEKQNKVLKKLLAEFVGVSVRESESITLLNNNLGIEAVQHVDPTLLLDAEDYLNLTSSKRIDGNYVFVYWLGAKDLVQKKIEEVRKSGKKVVTMFLRENKEQMSVEDWLSYIKYADYIITDSFHGCVFSIIFERQFVVELNKSGGIGRLSSLFKILGIQQEIINNSQINYEKLKERIAELQQDSKLYLLNCLH